MAQVGIKAADSNSIPDQKPSVGEMGTSHEKRMSASRLSTASRMSTAVFDAGIRSTGHFEIATKLESLTFREVCLLFLSMFISSLPALLFGILFSLFQAWYVNTIAGAVLDELSAQPSGWASAPDFNYLDHGKKLPPNGFTIAQHEAGELPYAGPDVVYGSRLDIVEKYNLDPEKWGNVPSMAYGLGLRLYYGSKITGHPDIGFWKGAVLPLLGHLITRPLSIGYAFVLFFILFSSKTNGRQGWVFVGLMATCLVWLSDIMNIHLATSYHTPRGELGPLWVYAPMAIQLVNSLWVYRMAHDSYGIVGAGRGCAFPTLVLVLMNALVQAYMWDRLNNATSSGDLLLIRLVLWPLFTELFTAPLRAVLRSIPEEWADKDWLSMAMVPLQLCFGLLGRLFVYRITEPWAMIVVNFALLFVELGTRLTVSHRDKFYARAFGCMPQSIIKTWFGQKHNVKFRCDNLIGEMCLEYYAMFSMFVQQFALIRRQNPEEASNGGIIFANLILQFILELACDTICMYVEVNKQKAPLVKAWEGRKRTWPFVFLLLVCCSGPYLMLSLPMGTCAMKHPDTGELMWMNCPAGY